MDNSNSSVERKLSVSRKEKIQQDPGYILRKASALRINSAFWEAIKSQTKTLEH